MHAPRRVTTVAGWILALTMLAGTAASAQTERKRTPESLRAWQEEDAQTGATRDMRIKPVDREAERQSELLNKKEPQEPDRDEREPVLGQAALDRVISRTEYKLGPGDVIVFGILGSTAQIPETEITPDGRLLVPEFGPVEVAGLSLDEAEARVAEVAGESYGNAKITLSIVRLRQFRVHVSGLVEYPGSYIATGAQRVSDMIVKAGGLQLEASTRRIRLVRANGERQLVDLDGFLKAGDRAANPTLDMGDVITVPAKGPIVMVSGAVGEPDEYEYRPGDTVERLISVAGGLTDNAMTSRIEWSTFPSDTGKPVIRTMDLNEILRNPRLNASVRAGDNIYIPPNNDWRRLQTVSVEGEVQHPGTLTIVEGETRLSDVIRRAGGLTDHAFPGGSFVVREPAEPGVDREFDRLSEIVQAVELNTEETRFYRTRGRQMFGVLGIDVEKAMESPGSADDPLLLDGDEVVIANRVVTVEVLGQVARPGLYRFEDGLSYKDYIEQAGGLAWHAKRGSIRVIRASSGNWIEPDSDTRINPGDRIFIPQVENFDYWQLAKDIVSLTAQVATVIVLMITISKA